MPLSSTSTAFLTPLIEVMQKLSTLQTSMVSAGRILIWLMRGPMNLSLSRKWTGRGQRRQYPFWTCVPSHMMANIRFWMIFPSPLTRVRPLLLWGIQVLGNRLLSSSCDFMNSSQGEFSWMMWISGTIVRKSWEKHRSGLAGDPFTHRDH